MTDAATHSIIDLARFTSIIASEFTSNEATWYRGCGKSSYELKPTLYRHPSEDTIEVLIQKESEIIDRFKERCIPHLDRQLVDDWEYLFLMQHHGVPTRLLDWSENPFVALYFALDSAPYKLVDGSRQYLEDAAFWALDPIRWNRSALQHMSFDQSILSANDHRVRAYAPKSELALMGNEPLAIYGAHNSPRMVAQRGVFTIFGKSTKAMEEISVSSSFQSGMVSKFVIPRESLCNLRREIDAIGITDATVFPDLDGLGKELKRNCGYEV
jgi:hypothetical protein